MAGIKGTKWAKNSKQSKQKLERLTLDEIWEIITDKRFSIRFKIANLICRDYLRNYVASALWNLNDCIRVLDDPYNSDNVKLKCISSKVKRASKTLNEVFDL